MSRSAVLLPECLAALFSASCTIRKQLLAGWPVMCTGWPCNENGRDDAGLFGENIGVPFEAFG